MAEEPVRKRRTYTRRPKADGGSGGGGGGSINWAHVELALGPVRARQWQRELQDAALAQAAAAQALLKSLGAAESASAAPRTTPRRPRRTITDPVVLENRRLALSKAREALAERRRQEAVNGPVQDLTGVGTTG